MRGDAPGSLFDVDVGALVTLESARRRGGRGGVPPLDVRGAEATVGARGRCGDGGGVELGVRERRAELAKLLLDERRGGAQGVSGSGRSGIAGGAVRGTTRRGKVRGTRRRATSGRGGLLHPHLRRDETKTLHAHPAPRTTSARTATRLASQYQYPSRPRQAIPSRILRLEKICR